MRKNCNKLFKHIKILQNKKTHKNKGTSPTNNPSHPMHTTQLTKVELRIQQVSSKPPPE